MLEIRNVILPNKSKESVVIDGSRIVNIGRNFLTEQFINGDNLLALPGLIDPHVHFRTPGGEHKEDWEHGIKAAIAGGVTTVFDMPNTNPTLTTAKRLEKKSEMVGERDIDYRFWFGATNNNLHEIKKVAGDPRIIGVKIYMGSSTGNLLVTDERVLEKIFRTCAEYGLVVGVHAECEERMLSNRRYLGHEPQVRDHCYIRDPGAEWKAVQQAVSLQRKTGCTLYLCHLSTPTSVEIAAQAKDDGASVYAEVCPHHVWLSQEKLSEPGPSKNFYKMNPPLREKSQVEKLQRYVCEGLVDTIGSDHAPHTRKEKMQENYDDIPSGVPGVETILPLIFRFVSEGKMSTDRFIGLTSGNAAKIFGVERKGKIEIGYDADIVLIDRNEEVLFRHQDMETKCEWTPFVAMRAKGAVKFVISRGKIVAGGEGVE